MTFDNIFRKSITQVQSLKDKGNPVNGNGGTRDPKQSNTFGLMTSPRVSKP